MSLRLLFVGEKRSPTAIRMGVTWRDARLCAYTLRQALEEAGVDLDACTYTNAFTDEGALSDEGLTLARRLVGEGAQVIGLGARAQRALRRAGIPHLAMIHPAARGAIRRTERYQAHVRTILAALPATSATR